jgi:NADPH:quinone reductase-like Zn-dependent oxidoreductase
LHASETHTRLQEGTKVAGFVHGGKYEDRGSFAEYLVSPTSVLTKVPDNVKDEVAVSIGIAGYTAVQVSVAPDCRCRRSG